MPITWTAKEFGRSKTLYVGALPFAQGAQAQEGILTFYDEPKIAKDQVKVRLVPWELSVLVPEEIVTSTGTASTSPKPTVKYKQATEVEIATWEDSFQHYNPEEKVYWWVQNDMRHIKVRIRRPDKAGMGSIKISIETLKSRADPADLPLVGDPNNEVNLVETETPGIFEYDMLLVSDDVDDIFDEKDETVNDSTHRIGVGGELIIKYENYEIKRFKIPERGRMKIRPLVLYNTKGPAINNAKVKDDVEDIQKRFAQAGIFVDWDGNAWGVDVTTVAGVTTEFKENAMVTYWELGPSPDETALSKHISTIAPYNSIGPKEILLIYSKALYVPYKTGSKIVEKKEKAAYTLIPALVSKLGWENVRPMIVTAADRNLHTIAHEALHITLDDVHPNDTGAAAGKHDTEYKFFRRLWAGPGEFLERDQNLFTDRKRMSSGVVTDVQKSPLVRP